MLQEQLWISLVEVEAVDGNRDYPRGHKAFVNVIASARSERHALESIRKALHRLKFHAVSFEDTEPWVTRIANYSATPSIRRLASVAERTREPQFGNFHYWDKQG